MKLQLQNHLPLTMMGSLLSKYYKNLQIIYFEIVNFKQKYNYYEKSVLTHVEKHGWNIQKNVWVSAFLL